MQPNKQLLNCVRRKFVNFCGLKKDTHRRQEKIGLFLSLVVNQEQFGNQKYLLEQKKIIIIL